MRHPLTQQRDDSRKGPTLWSQCQLPEETGRVFTKCVKHDKVAHHCITAWVSAVEGTLVAWPLPGDRHLSARVGGAYADEALGDGIKLGCRGERFLPCH